MRPVHPRQTPHLVFANERGEIKDFPRLAMAGRSGTRLLPPERQDLIPLPAGSELFVLPDRLPVGIDPATGEPVLLDRDPENPKEKIQAVAAFMAPAHTAILTAAFESARRVPRRLPLFAYTAVGWYGDRFWAAGFRSDIDRRQDADQFQTERIRKAARKKLAEHGRNRLMQHLGKCCLTYGCPAARNYFLARWEAPLPTSPACNASCIGCISSQPADSCPATQDRITFIPSPREIVDIAAPHLQRAPKAVVSFGQGCEGEPLLQTATIVRAVEQLRRRTGRGTINLNSNASRPEAIERLARAGLDSIRVSMNSARPKYHHRYYRPRDFDFTHVLGSIRVMKRHHRFVSLNYFIMPGFTDDPEEFSAFCSLIEDYRPDLIQLRNLNMDPDWYFSSIRYHSHHPPMGIRAWHRRLAKLFPQLRFGYFNPALHR